MPVDLDGLSYEELLELNHRVVERLKMLEAMQAHVSMMRFNLGQRVSFDSQYGRQVGTVVKYNRKTVTVLGENGSQWRISPGLLSPMKDVPPEPASSQRSVAKKKQLR
jgi:hypothetical protein